MSNEDLKHILAKLLQDAQRIQQIEPNAGTAVRIEEAKAALADQLAGVNSAYSQGTVVTNLGVSVHGQTHDLDKTEFWDLPQELQIAAADTLKTIISLNNLDSEQAVESARSVRKAFIQLYEGDN